MKNLIAVALLLATSLVNGQPDQVTGVQATTQPHQELPMAIGTSPVQTANDKGSSVSFISNVAGDNYIIVLTGTDSGEAVTNVTDDASGGSNSYTEVVANGTATRECSIWFARNDNGADEALTVTITTEVPSDIGHIHIAEWNSDNDLEIDQTNTADSLNQTNHPKGEITTGHAETIVVGILRSNNAFSVTSRESGYTQLEATDRTDSQYQHYSSTTTTDGDITTADDEKGGNCIASFNEVAAGGATGSGALTLQALALSAQGVQTQEGTGTLALSQAVLAADAVMEPQGAGALLFDAATIAAQGAQDIPGAAALLLAKAVLGADAVMVPAGQAAIVLDGVVLAGLGAQAIPGAAAVTLPEALLRGDALMQPEATGVVLLDVLTLAAQGQHGEPEGTGALVLGQATLAADAAMLPEGQGAVTVPVLVLSGAVAQEIPGTATLVLDTAALTATGEHAHAATGVLLLDQAALTAQAEQLLDGSGALVLEVVVLSAAEGGAPSVEGLEYTAPTNRLHFTGRIMRLHYTAPRSRLHYSARDED